MPDSRMSADSPNTSLAIRRRVLAVDDDRVMRAVITRVLRGAGIDVVAVEVDEALRLLEDNEFDLVICDRSMPGVSGQQFLDVVRSDHRYDFTPFLFLTVSDQIADIIDGFDSGADDYIIKPFDNGELIARGRGIRQGTCVDIDIGAMHRTVRLGPGKNMGTGQSRHREPHR